MMLPAHIYRKESDSSLVLPDQTCGCLTLAEIQSATHNFDEKLVIGHGGFGKVYRCPMTIGSVAREVAIKRLDSTSEQGATEFEAEVKLLSKLWHGNLVSLIGYCNEENEMILVYEFMPNGTIRDHLRKADCALSWLQRLKICIGAARALDYLHTGPATQQGVIHRDVKTSNILLDANFAAKVSDFGLAKVSPINQTKTHVSTQVKGSYGYLDPCYISSNELTIKSDVYAFGVVLFEVLTGKQAVFSTLDEGHWTLSGWAQDQIKKGKLNQLIDFRLKGQISRKCLKKYSSIADKCLRNEPNQRPTMAEVVVKLESILSQETKSVDSVFDEGTFSYKLRSFFTHKADVSAHRIQKSKNERIFTFVGLGSATNNFFDEEHSSCLDKLLYGEEGGTSLSWVARLKIALGAAQHLSFLHQRNHPVYLQFKTTCILVDANFNARLLDIEEELFSDSPYSIRNFAYYAAPEWFRYHADMFDGLCWSPRPQISSYQGFGFESEIYSLGVIMLEILTGMEVFDENRSEEKQKLVKWATPLLPNEVNLVEIMDPKLLLNNCPPKGAFKLAVLISNCLQASSENRPSMEEILQVLNECHHENK